MTTISFYLQQNVSGTVQVLTGTWVRLTNNSTSATFISTAASDTNGLITVNSVPAGSYTVATGPTNVGAWTNTGDGNFTVEATDNANLTTIPGDITMSGAPGKISMTGTGQAKIVSGTTGIVVRDNSDANSLLSSDNAGLIAVRNAISVPPSVGASLPTTSYGTLPVKLDEQSGASDATKTLTVPAGALFRTLVIHFTGRSDNAAAQAVLAQFNADTGANYDYQYLSDTNATVSGIAPTVAGTSGRVAVLTPSGATAGAIGSFTITIYNADSTTLRKNWTWDGGWWATDAAASATKESGQGQWRNTANAITSIKLTPSANNLVSWRAVLYGWP